METRLRVVLGFLGLSLILGGCGDEASCVDLCEEGQERDCTSIEGDCGAFCEAVSSVQGPSGCEGERSEYQDCLEEDGVCADCDALEDELTECVTAYCVGHVDRHDCQTLAASF